MNRKERMYQEIERHGKDLNTIFNLFGDPIALCKRLHRVEVVAHRAATDYCNGEIETEDWEKITDTLLKRLDKILNFKAQNIPIIINGDARGYALKIKDDYLREKDFRIYKDWGGYGIIAPEFDGRDNV